MLLPRYRFELTLPRVSIRLGTIAVALTAATSLPAAATLTTATAPGDPLASRASRVASVQPGPGSEAPWVCDQSPLWITNARLQQDPTRVIAVEILGGTIRRIVAAPEDLPDLSPDVRTLDAEGALLLPGLIDAHAHLDTLPAAKKRGRELDFLSQVLPITARSTLLSGVTAARIHLSRFDDLAILSAVSEDPCFPGPRMQLGGPGLLGGAPDASSPLMVGARDVAQIQSHIFRAADEGASWIALHGVSRFSAEQLRTIEAAAAGASLQLMASADTVEDFAAALGTSARTLEYLDRSQAQRLPDALVQAAAGKVAVVPPIGYYRVASELRAGEGALPEQPPLGYEVVPGLWSDVVRSLPREIEADDYVARIAASLSTHRAKFRQLAQAGVALLIGSDSGSTGQFHDRALWNEIDTWSRYETARQEIVRAATSAAASWLAWPDVGEIRPGSPCRSTALPR